jgi:hypothetical protein
MGTPGSSPKNLSATLLPFDGLQGSPVNLQRAGRQTAVCRTPRLRKAYIESRGLRLPVLAQIGVALTG